MCLYGFIAHDLSGRAFPSRPSGPWSVGVVELFLLCRGIPLFREDVTIGADLWADCLSSLWKLGATIFDLGVASGST